MAKVGRPSGYDIETAERLCMCITQGASLGKACKTVGVSPAAVFKWLRLHKDFEEKYARSVHERTEWHVERIHDQLEEPIDVDEHGRMDPAAVNLLRLKIDTMKWCASKLLPKKYGDKIQQEHSGPGGAPIQVVTGVPGAAQPAAIEAQPTPMLLDVPPLTIDAATDND